MEAVNGLYSSTASTKRLAHPEGCWYSTPANGEILADGRKTPMELAFDEATNDIFVVSCGEGTVRSINGDR